MNTSVLAQRRPGWDGVEDPSSRSGARISASLLALGVFLSCFHLWRVGAINLTFSDALFSVALVRLGAAGRLQWNFFAVLTPIWLICLAAMLAALLVSSLANGDVFRWAIVAAQYLFTFLCLPMLFLGLSQLELRRLILFLIAGVTVVEATGIAAYHLMGSHEVANAWFGPDFLTGGRRLGSFVGDANWNGAIIAMTLPFVIYAVRTHLLGAVLGLAAAAVMVWGILLCASFTAFSAASLAIVLSMIIGRSLPSVRVVILFGAMVVALAASGYRPPDIFEKRVAPALQSGSLDNAGTYGARADLIQEAWLKVEDTTILGLGADQYREFNAQSQPVHNTYLLLWAEGGFVAMLAWVGLLFILLLVPLSILRWHRLESALCLSVLTVFLINTMASPHMYHRLWIVPVLLAVGIALRAHTPVLLPTEYSDGPEDPAGIAPRT